MMKITENPMFKEMYEKYYDAYFPHYYTDEDENELVDKISDYTYKAITKKPKSYGDVLVNSVLVNNEKGKKLPTEKENIQNFLEKYRKNWKTFSYRIKDKKIKIKHHDKNDKQLDLSFSMFMGLLCFGSGMLLSMVTNMLGFICSILAFVFGTIVVVQTEIENCKKEEKVNFFMEQAIGFILLLTLWFSIFNYYDYVYEHRTENNIKVGEYLEDFHEKVPEKLYKL